MFPHPSFIILRRQACNEHLVDILLNPTLRSPHKHGHLVITGNLFYPGKMPLQFLKDVHVKIFQSIDFLKFLLQSDNELLVSKMTKK